jgi:two-component system sensor histidine kinase HydH
MTSSVEKPSIADDDSDQTRHAIWMSAILSLAYVFLCGFYIAFSSEIAAQLSSSVTQLHRIELAKGLVFVVVTGLSSFGISYFLLRRMMAQEGRILRQEKALTASEGRAMAGIFASSIAHDMGNLLTAIRINLHLLRQELGDAANTRALNDVERATTDLADLSSRLIVIGRDRKPDQVQMVDLAAGVGKVATFASSHALIRRCRVTTRVEGHPQVQADPAMLARMLVNLVLNAAEAAGKGGRVDIRLWQDQSGIHLEVHDNGPGIPPELREKVFDPFYTTKEHGTGLGLLSVKVCAKEYKGTVEVLQSDLGGACFRVTFPAEPPK